MTAEHGSPLPLSRRARRVGERRIRRIERRILVMAAAVALLLGVGGGTAWAYFAAQGTGSGAASVGKVTSVTIKTTTGTVTPKLQPGGSGNLRFTITNPNKFSVTITAIAQNGTISVTGGAATCTASTAGVTVPSQTGLTITVTQGTHSYTLTTGAQMATTSADGCQGASFSIPVKLTVEK